MALSLWLSLSLTSSLEGEKMDTKHAKRLESKGLKKTEPRKKVLDVMSSTDQFLSAEAIHAIVDTKKRPVSLSTVYRILETFKAVGIVSSVSLENAKEERFELSHEHHAHHLICTSCERVIHVHGCPLDHYEKSLQKTHDFTIEDHRLDFYGLCKACRDKRI